MLDGTGTLGADRTVTVTGGRRATVDRSPATHVILAAGLGAPHDPRLRRRRHARHDVRRGARRSTAAARPAAVVIGGGAIGCEFASMMADLGSQVTVLEALPKILPGCDKDVDRRSSSARSRSGASRCAPGVNGHRPRARRRRHGRATSRAATPSRPTSSSCRSAAGRPPTTSASTARGVKVDERGFVVVDELCRTGEDGVCAVGDVIATPGARPRRLRRGASSPSSDILGEDAVPGRLRQGAVVHLLPPRGRLRRPLRGGGQGGRATTS